jgi:hypothetical protein
VNGPEVSFPRSTPPANPQAVRAAVFATLLLVYLTSLAPDLTLWDAGEFNAAVATLGIPHPPGTPLYVFLGRSWSMALGFVPQVVAMNALSALATAAACALLGGEVARIVRHPAAGVAAGVSAGAMYSVWQNATETEVYALSFLLLILLVVSAARSSEERRARQLVAFLMGLSVPLQISALVGTPAAVGLAAAGAPPSQRTLVALTLGSSALLAIGLGTASWPLISMAVLLALVAALVARALRSAGERVWSYPLLTLLGASATLVMLVRAVHDPAVNQGNPSNWASFVDVVARRQYDVPGLLPRRAPLWLQVANFGQYADWQVAFGIDSSTRGSLLRLVGTLGFGVLAVAGWRSLGRCDPRFASLGAGILLMSTSLGVVLVLNLRPGPSIGYSVVPAEEGHEPRERDYFFAPAFALGGALAGAGAVSLLGPRIGMLVAALPLALNWKATDRRRVPDAVLASTLGKAILASAPEQAVLLLGGDNDTYAVWYTQQVLRVRRDVTPVTLPLLPAHWYRHELQRRHQLLANGGATWLGEQATLSEIARRSRELGRPLAVALSVPASLRQPLAERWVVRGMVVFPAEKGSGSERYLLDSAGTAAVDSLIRGVIAAGAGPARDPAGRYVQRLLRCPAEVLSRGTQAALDPICELR